MWACACVHGLVVYGELAAGLEADFSLKLVWEFLQKVLGSLGQSHSFLGGRSAAVIRHGSAAVVGALGHLCHCSDI